MSFSLLKQLLPDRAVLLPVLSGPFRGARIHMNPRHSLRKVFGIYEHELNSWLTSVLPRVNTVLDVGANDGYFSFGCAAAFERRKQKAAIVAFEPEARHVQELNTTLHAQSYRSVGMSVRQQAVGGSSQPGMTALDGMAQNIGSALIKIDVEGAEMDVIEGASSWLKATNYFLIEVHHEDYFRRLQDQFEARGITLQKTCQRPLPFLDKEARSVANGWLVSKLA